MSFLFSLLLSLNRFLWNGPLLFLLLGTHLFFTIKLRFVQRNVLTSFPLQNSQKKSGLASLSTALAATLGTGNIVGVSSAIALGGPGAVFWCFLTGFLGMATSYAESFLCMKYRRDDKDGRTVGGIMYVFEFALKNKLFGRLFAILLLIASFGIGCSTQAGTVTETMVSLTGCKPVFSAVLLVFLVGYVILHGSKAIKNLCSFLVPVMAAFYFISCFVLLVLNHEFIFSALKLILSSAFSGRAALSGTGAGAFLLSARYGVARGLFTNEAGLGTAPLAFVTDKKNTPAGAAHLSMSAVFFDTVILCSLTGVVIVSSLLKNPALANGYSATTLTTAAFSVLPLGRELLSISLIAFAYATLVGWSYFGAQAVIYLFGSSSLKVYRICYLFMIFLGSLLSLPFVFELTDFINALMVLPNVYALLSLKDQIFPQEKKVPFKKRKGTKNLL